MYICTWAFLPHRQVFQSTITLQSSSGSLRIALPCNPQKSHAACFEGKIVMFEVGSRRRLSGAWCAQGKKMQECMRRNTWLACRPASTQLEISLSLGKSGAVVAGCDVTQARVGVQGHILDASGSTRQQSTLTSVVQRLSSCCPCAPPNDLGIRTPHFAWNHFISENLNQISDFGSGLLPLPNAFLYPIGPAQEWTNRTLISHKPLICSKMCFTKTESVQ